MTKIEFATDEQMVEIRRAAVNDITRAIARDGVRLTWSQAEDLGDVATDWLCKRLGLRSSTDSDGVTFAPGED